VPEQARTDLADTQAELLVVGPAADSSGPARAR
jgi:hypothetical protein